MGYFKAGEARGEGTGLVVAGNESVSVSDSDMLLSLLLLLLISLIILRRRVRCLRG